MSSSSEKRCPVCGSGSLRRVERKRWMHLIPKSRSYDCKKCYSKFMLVFGDKEIVLVNTIGKVSKEEKKAKSEEVSPEKPADESSGERVKEPDKKEFTAKPDRVYGLYKTRLIADVKAEIRSWQRKRFWFIVLIVLIVGFIGIRALVYQMLDRELREAMKTARLAQTAAEQALEAKRTARAQVGLYEEVMRELERDAEESAKTIADLEERLRTRRSSSASRSDPTVAALLRRIDQLEKSLTNNVEDLREQQRRQAQPPEKVLTEEERRSENALYEVMVVTTSSRPTPAADQLLNKLAADGFKTSSATWADPSRTRSDIEIRYTLDAVKKAREIKTALASVYSELGQRSPNVSMHYGFPQDPNIDSENGRYVRVYF